MNEKKLPLNSLHLKLLAAASMLIDHMGFTLFPFAHWMRCVGRLAFPIFCFLIAYISKTYSVLNLLVGFS